MKIIINHLTRMARGKICAAGYDLEKKRHIRPVLHMANLKREHLRSNNGLFSVGSIVDIGTPTDIGNPPEVEDHKFVPAQSKHIKTMTAPDFWRFLNSIAKDKLRTIFGNDLQLIDKDSCGVPPHKGIASLGVYRPIGKMRLYIRPRSVFPSTVRFVIEQPTMKFDFSVTDMRLYDDMFVHPNRNVVMELARKIDRGAPLLLSVGLTREWQGWHWLQVNNIHLADRAVW